MTSLLTSPLRSSDTRTTRHGVVIGPVIAAGVRQPQRRLRPDSAARRDTTPDARARAAPRTPPLAVRLQRHAGVAGERGLGDRRIAARAGQLVGHRRRRPVAGRHVVDHPLHVASPRSGRADRASTSSTRGKMEGRRFVGRPRCRSPGTRKRNPTPSLNARTVDRERRAVSCDAEARAVRLLLRSCAIACTPRVGYSWFVLRRRMARPGSTPSPRFDAVDDDAGVRGLEHRDAVARDS